MTRRHRISRALVRLAAKINDQPNVRYTISYDMPLTWPPGITRTEELRTCIGDSGHNGPCCDNFGHMWDDSRHGYAERAVSP
jgi:hypothetical protein